MLFQFLWDKKRGKISRKIICQPYEEGGLKMVDVFSFVACMKIGWLRRLFFQESDYLKLVEAFIPNIKNLCKFGGEFANKLIQEIQNPFWKDVLKHYKKN